MEAQRFPEDYDGIIAGDPANNWNHLMLGELWTGLVSGLRDPANALPQAKLDVLMNALLLACDGNDGIVDGIVEDPRTCNFDPTVVRCPGGDAPDCLTDGQLEAIRQIYAGTSNPATRERIFPGFAHSSENALRQVLVGLPIPGGSSFSFFRDGIFADPAWNFRAFDFSVEPARTDNTIAGSETYGAALNANDPDLRPFANRGGKLILYHGWSDPFITPYNTINYYESVVSLIGGHRARDRRAGAGADQGRGVGSADRRDRGGGVAARIPRPGAAHGRVLGVPARRSQPGAGGPRGPGVGDDRREEDRVNSRLTRAGASAG